MSVRGVGKDLKVAVRPEMEVVSEIVCRSKECEHNDYPNCLAKSKNKAVVLEKGRCIEYKEK